MKKLLIGMASLMTVLMTLPLAAQDATDAMPPRDQGAWQMFIVLGMGLVFFYFILWRPEQKRRKMMEEQRSSLKKGDQVTAMGILGTVVRVTEHTVILRMVDGAKIEFLKAAISDVRPGSEDDIKKVEKDD